MRTKILLTAISTMMIASLALASDNGHVKTNTQRRKTGMSQSASKNQTRSTETTARKSTENRSEKFTEAVTTNSNTKRRTGSAQGKR